MAIRLTVLGFVLAAFAILAAAASAAEAVGAVVSVRGDCRIEGETGAGALREAAPVHLGDIVSTGAAARLVVRLDDGTTLTLGENAGLRIDEFVFARPDAADRLKMFVAGAFRFTSGQIAGNRPEVVEIATPVPALGLRGTDFWAGPLDGNYSVLVFEGAVEVASAGASVILNDPGEGTNIEGDGPPGPVTQWPQAKVDRALASVAF